MRSGFSRLDGNPNCDAVAARDHLRGGESRRQNQVRDIAAQLRVGREIFVAQAEIDGQSARDPVIVLRVNAGGPAAKVVVVAAETQRARLRQAQQKIRKIESGARHRLSGRVQLAGRASPEKLNDPRAF